MKSTKAVKVVKAICNRYYSPIVWKENLKVKYVPNKYVRARDEYLNHLFVFDCVSNAKKFIKEYDVDFAEIWECRIRNGRVPANYKQLPTGTIFANEVKITKKLN